MHGGTTSNSGYIWLPGTNMYKSATLGAQGIETSCSCDKGHFMTSPPNFYPGVKQVLIMFAMPSRKHTRACQIFKCHWIRCSSSTLWQKQEMKSQASRASPFWFQLTSAECRWATYTNLNSRTRSVSFNQWWWGSLNMFRSNDSRANHDTLQFRTRQTQLYISLWIYIYIIKWMSFINRTIHSWW